MRKASMKRFRKHEGDDGIALVIAVALIGLVTTLMLVLVSYALRETGSTGKDRQRSSAVTAAEGQVDATFAKIQNVGRGSVPCGPLTAVASRQSARDTTQVTTTVIYYDASGAIIPCSSLSTIVATQAKVTSVATSAPLAGQTPAKRTIESLATLTPVLSVASDKAIFGDKGTSLGNSATVTGYQGKPNAKTYSNGDVTCANSGTQHGDLESQGNMLVKGSCTVHGNVHSNKGVILEGSVTVDGQVLAHDGDIDMGGTAVIGGARASGDIDFLLPRGCSTATCVPHTDVPAVPRAEFPKIFFNEVDWRAAGYVVVTDQNNCSPAAGALNNPSTWIQANGNATGRLKTVLVTDCRISYGNSTVVVLSNDLAVFARDGFDFANSVTFSSPGDGPNKSLHLIQPFGSPCFASPPGINIGNSLVIEGSVASFMYSPCDVVFLNSATMKGQIYGGSKVIINNSITLHYVPVPVPGLSVSGSGSTTVAYTLDVVYKRETR